MKVEETSLPGVLLIEPRVFGDERGYFLETFRAERYQAVGIAGPFVQDNLSFSRGPVLRGLHLQHPRAQGKLVSVLAGEVFDVAVDVRPGSLGFGCWTGVLLSGENKRQLYIPPGFAHGFCALSETVLFAYKCTDVYVPETEITVRWDDPEIGIAWPVAEPILSARDAAAPCLREIDANRLPSYAEVGT